MYDLGDMIDSGDLSFNCGIDLMVDSSLTLEVSLSLMVARIQSALHDAVLTHLISLQVFKEILPIKVTI